MDSLIPHVEWTFKTEYLIKGQLSDPTVVNANDSRETLA